LEVTFLAFKKRPLKVIGVDIGTNTVKMVEILSSDNPKIIKWACMEIPSGSLGDLRNPDKVIIKTLKHCMRKLRPSTRISSICLSDPAVIVKELTMPSMGEKEMLDNIRFELSEYFSSDLKEYQLSYRLLKNGQNDNKDKISVLVAAAPLSLLNRHKNLVRKGGLNLKYIDVPANCIIKLLAKMSTDKNANGNLRLSEVLCVADLGANNIEISIYEKGNFCLSKNIDVAGSNYDESVVYELLQVIDYYHRKNYESRIAKIVLTGGRSYTEGLAEYISNQLLLPVEIVRPDMFAIAGTVKEEKKRRRNKGKNEEFPMALYFKALGSAMRED
jgi:Tfp pilus assembly PilM family ATPase